MIWTDFTHLSAALLMVYTYVGLGGNVDLTCLVVARPGGRDAHMAMLAAQVGNVSQLWNPLLRYVDSWGKML